MRIMNFVQHLSAARLPQTFCRWRYFQRLEKTRLAAFSTSTACRGVFEPDDLDTEPEIPEYGEINVRIRGYDYAVLDSFAKYVYQTGKMLNMSVTRWPVPRRSTRATTYKPGSSILDQTYDLDTFERMVQLQDVPSTLLPIFFETIRNNTPQGVQITLKEPDEEENQHRFLPDRELDSLKESLEALKTEKVGKKGKFTLKKK